MSNHLAIIRRAAFFGFVLVFVVSFAYSVFAQDIFEELNKAVEGTGLEGKSDLPDLVSQVVSVVLSLAGTASVILLIVGGFMWMTSAGNEEKLKKAKGMIQAAIVGLVIVMLAYVVVSFVFEKGIGIIGG